MLRVNIRNVIGTYWHLYI